MPSKRIVIIKEFADVFGEDRRKKDGARMKSDVSDEITRIGLENLAEILQVTPKKLMVKVEHPELFTLKDLVTLQGELGFTDNMVLLMLEKLKKRE